MTYTKNEWLQYSRKYTHLKFKNNFFFGLFMAKNQKFSIENVMKFFDILDLTRVIHNIFSQFNFILLKI